MSRRDADALRDRLDLYRSLLRRAGPVEPLARLVDLLESELRREPDDRFTDPPASA